MTHVLFVDIRNTARSPMAEAWFNQLALGWGRASSCGTMPAAQFDLLAVQVMAEIGAPIRPHLPRALTQQMLVRADLVIVMGADVPASALPSPLIWNFPDPTGANLEFYRALREQIRERVHELINLLHPALHQSVAQTP